MKTPPSPLVPGSSPWTLVVCARPGPNGAWRASLVDVRTQERREFASPEELARFLALALAEPDADRPVPPARPEPLGRIVP